MFENFESHLTSHASFTEDELRQIRSLAVAKKFRKRQFLMREGEVCRNKIFVCKGLLKTYITKNDGMEYIMRFAAENSWTIDHESYNNQTPSRFNIEAVEDTEVLLFSKENFEALSIAITSLKDLSEKLKAKSMDASQDRILMNISFTAEEKYQQFVDSFPDLFGRIPLHMVASYLGVSRETLSRVRHAQLKRLKEI